MNEALVAGAPRTIDVVAAALSQRVEVVRCTTTAQANANLRIKRSLIVCGVCFDESRMFEFLNQLKSYPANAATPVVCINVIEPLRTVTATQGVDYATKAIGAKAFIDFFALRKEFGNEMAEHRLRQYLCHRFFPESAPC